MSKPEHILPCDGTDELNIPLIPRQLPPQAAPDPAAPDPAAADAAPAADESPAADEDWHTDHRRDWLHVERGYSAGHVGSRIGGGCGHE